MTTPGMDAVNAAADSDMREAGAECEHPHQTAECEDWICNDCGVICADDPDAEIRTIAAGRRRVGDLSGESRYMALCWIADHYPDIAGEALAYAERDAATVAAAAEIIRARAGL